MNKETIEWVIDEMRLAVIGGSIIPAKIERWIRILTDDLKCSKNVTTAKVVHIYDPDRIGKWEADAAQDEANRHLARLVGHAVQAATKAELAEIDQSACIVIDALEKLARGVVRPDLSPEQLKQGA